MAQLNPKLNDPKAKKQVASAQRYIEQHVYVKDDSDEFFRKCYAFSILVRHDVMQYQHVPMKFRTAEVAYWGVQQDPYNLRNTPNESKTYDVCLAAVSKKGSMLQDVPKELIDEKMAWTAVENDQIGTAMYWIPELMRTPEMCDLAVKNAPRALATVPNKLRTSDLCLSAVQRDPNLMTAVYGKAKREWVMRNLTPQQQHEVQWRNDQRNRKGAYAPKPRVRK